MTESFNPHGRARNEPTSREPITLALLDLIAQSGMTDKHIVKKAGLYKHQISRWRLDHITPRAIEISSVLQVLGYRIRIEKDTRYDAS